VYACVLYFINYLLALEIITVKKMLFTIIIFKIIIFLDFNIFFFSNMHLGLGLFNEGHQPLKAKS